MITSKELSGHLAAETLLNSMPGVAFIFSEDGNLVGWNNNAEKILGYSSDELKCGAVARFASAEDKEKIKNGFLTALKDGYYQTEFNAETRDGKLLPMMTTATKIIINNNTFVLGLALDLNEMHEARLKIKKQHELILSLNEKLLAENVYLNDQLKMSSGKREIVGESEALRYVQFKISQVAPTDASVLIEGETGTGKELIARAIHKESRRKSKPFIKVNCASIPENLIESELFGHERGAFTGAVEKRIGRFELANGGTIFLDEIGELPLNIQPKLLHVLQQGEFERIGSSKTIKTDVRVIAATNRILQDEIKAGRFRTDLFFRLNVFPISISPLRERKADIPVLADFYIRYYSEKLKKPIDTINKDSLKRLLEYQWPGNVRELENVIERAIITSSSRTLVIESLPKSQSSHSEYIPLEELERNYIIKALQKTYWKISGTGGAAYLLKINPETLRSKMRKLGIKREV